MIHKTVSCAAILLFFVSSASAAEDPFDFFRLDDCLEHTVDNTCTLAPYPSAGYYCYRNDRGAQLDYDQDGEGYYNEVSLKTKRVNNAADTRYTRRVYSYYAYGAHKNKNTPPTFYATISPTSKGSTTNVHHIARDHSMQYRSLWEHAAALGVSPQPVDGGYTSADEYQASSLSVRSNYPVFEQMTPLEPGEASNFLSTLLSQDPHYAITHSIVFGITKKLCGSYRNLKIFDINDTRREEHVLISVQATSADYGLAGGITGDVYIIRINDVGISWPLYAPEIAAGTTIEHYNFDGDDPDYLLVPNEVVMNSEIQTVEDFIESLKDGLGFECKSPIYDKNDDDDPIAGNQQASLEDSVDLVALGFPSSRGDLNRDGHTTIADLNWYRANIDEHYGSLYLYPLSERGNILDSIRSNLGANSIYSLNSPTLPMTLTEVLKKHLFEILPGDANCDFRVGSSDLDLVRGNYGSSTPLCMYGDVNCDGAVTSADTDIVRANWGN